jgi:hypothetical protein
MGEAGGALAHARAADATAFEAVGTRWVEHDGLQIFRAKAAPLRNASEHPRPDLVVIVKREHNIWPALARECAVGTGLALLDPADV